MAKMTWLERRYRRSRLDYVRHITIDPRGPGVVRIHMIPPRTEDPADPFLLLLNGAQLVPLNLSWAILLANFMDQLEPWSGIWDGEPCRRIRAESAKMEHICQLRQEGGC